MAATGTPWEEISSEFDLARTRVLKSRQARNVVPEFVLQCQTLHEFWSHIKPIGGYRERRDYLRNAFASALQLLSGGVNSPGTDYVTQVLDQTYSHWIQTNWKNALDRRYSDPSGAITSAKSLVESICKLVLDERNRSYTRTESLPQLFKKVRDEIALDPANQLSDYGRTVCSSLIQIVNAVSTMRNDVGDSHGHGGSVQPAEIADAELVVAAAGAVSTYLVKVLNMESDIFPTRPTRIKVS